MSSPQKPIPLASVTSLLDEVVLSSPADETEIVWIELRRRRASQTPRRSSTEEHLERTSLLRVRERARQGRYTCGTCEAGELHRGLRTALAHARITPLPDGELTLPSDGEPDPPALELFDSELARLTLGRGQELLANVCGGAAGVLEWLEGRVAIRNSLGLRRAARLTAANLRVESGRGPGAGRAAHAARTLEGLAAEETAARARALEGPGKRSTRLPGAPMPVVLSAQATAALLLSLGTEAARARRDRHLRSSLRRELGSQRFDRRLQVVEDATDPGGLPFPFDFSGRTKRRIAVLHDGAAQAILSTPELADPALGPMPTSLGGGEAGVSSLGLLPGDKDEEELWALAEGGAWIGWLDSAWCTDLPRGHFRARARGVRRIRDGALGEVVGDQLWEDNLWQLLSSLIEIGRERRTWSPAPLGFTAVCAPSMALTAAGSLTATS